MKYGNPMFTAAKKVPTSIGNWKSEFIEFISYTKRGWIMDSYISQVNHTQKEIENITALSCHRLLLNFQGKSAYSSTHEKGVPIRLIKDHMKRFKRHSTLPLILSVFTGLLSFFHQQEFVWSAENDKTPVVYLSTYTGSNTDYIYGEKIESNSQAVVAIIPETRYAKTVKTNMSFDYAESLYQVYTVDDRLFLLDVANPDDFEYTSIDLYDLDPVSFESGERNMIQNEPSQDNFAIVGSIAYYKRHRYYSFGRHHGGEFMVYDLSSPAPGRPQQLLASDHPDNENCLYFSDNGNLYAIYHIEDQLQISRRDLTTGEVAEVLGSFTVNDFEQYDNSWKFDIDSDAAYWARVSDSDDRVELWRYDFVNSPELLFSEVLFNDCGTTLRDLEMDVDNGYVLLYSYFCNYFVLFDSVENTSSKIDVGTASFYNGAILYQDHPEIEESGQNSDNENDGEDGESGNGGGGGCFISEIIGTSQLKKKSIKSRQ
jgi:hypothetical protein